jgi:hypothetical protein
MAVLARLFYGVLAGYGIHPDGVSVGFGVNPGQIDDRGVAVAVTVAVAVAVGAAVAVAVGVGGAVGVGDGVLSGVGLGCSGQPTSLERPLSIPAMFNAVKAKKYCVWSSRPSSEYKVTSPTSRSSV